MKTIRCGVSILILAAVSLAQPAPSLQELDTQGKSLIKANDLKGAEALYRSAVEQARAQKDQAWEAEFLRAVGETFERRGQLREAVAQYEASLEIRTQRGDKQEIAFLDRGIGKVSRDLREDAKAEDLLQKSRSAYLDLGQPREAGIAVQMLGQVRINQNRLADAIALLKEAAQLFEVSHDEVNGALVRDDVSAVYLRQSDYRAALEAAFEAIDMQRRHPNDPFLHVSDERLGNTFLAMEQPDKALAYYQHCLELRIRLQNPAAIAQAYNNVGNTLIKLNRPGGALDALNKALEIRQNLRIPPAIVETLLNIGVARESSGNFAEAQKSLDEALKIAEERKYAGQTALIRYNLGNLAIRARELDAGIDQHSRALAIRQQLGDRLGAVHSMNRLAIAYELKNDLERAEKIHAAALDEFEKIAAGVNDPAQIGRFRTSTVVLYPHYARVLLKSGKAEAALAIAERSRGAGLARMSEINRRGFSAALSEADRASWIAAEAAHASARNRLEAALAASSPEPAREQARTDLLQAENALEQLRDRIYSRTPNLAARPTAPPEMKALLASSRAERGALFLEWLMVDESSTLLFAVSDGAVRGWELPVGRATLSKNLQRWRGSLEQGVVRGVLVTRPSKPDAATEQESARQLYTAIFGPVAQEFEQAKVSRLVLIPDGPLLDLPFAGLLDDQGKRLIEKYPLTTSISLASGLPAPARHVAARSLLAIGDPIEPGQTRVVAPGGDRFEPLATARAEAKGVAALFPGSLALVGSDAREQRVKQEIANYRILHFATHGVLSKIDGMQSGLLLANEAATGREDGLLQAWEIADIPLSADLAVLSACETAEGDERLGDGLMGLAWAFQAAGCPNVIASLWSIDDEATQQVMSHFYKALREGKRIDEAMRSAMLAVKASERTSSPYFWAGFRLLGAAGSI